MLNVYTNYYKPQDQQRHLEILFCINKLQCDPTIDHLYVFDDSGTLTPTEKAIIIPNKQQRLTFRDLFIFVNKTTKPDDINIILNSDCYFDYESTKLLLLLPEDEVWALSRWNIDSLEPFKTSQNSPEYHGQDAWIFYGKIKQLHIDSVLGRIGCDSRMAFELQQAYGKNKVHNPSHSIKLYHLHHSKERHWGEVVPPPHSDIKDTYLPLGLEFIGKNDLCICHHIGMGDFLICNGLVRTYAKFCKHIHLCVTKRYADNVRFMYRDLSNISLIVGGDDHNYFDNMLDKLGVKDSILSEFTCSATNVPMKILTLGYSEDYYQQAEIYGFDREFYRRVNIDFSRRWTNFYYVRDYTREKELFEKEGLKEGQYIFLHEDHTRNWVIDRKYIENKDLRVYSPTTSGMIFDYGYIIQNAKEIHCINSSFKHLADSIDLNTDKLYYHEKYIGRGYNTVSGKNWKLL